MRTALKKVRIMSNIVLNKIAKRPPRVIVTRVVVMYRCIETGAEFHKWMDLPLTLHEGDVMEMTVGFDEFEQYSG